MKTFRWIIRIAVLLATAVTLLGCSLVFMSIGALQDSKKPDYHAIGGNSLLTLKRGDLIRLRLKSSDVVEGVYVGLQPVPEEVYRSAYKAALSGDSSLKSLPELGEEVTIYLKDMEKPLSGQHAGFDIGGRLLIQPPGQTTVKPLSLHRVARWRRANGKEVDLAAAEYAIATFAVPLRSQIRVHSQGQLPQTYRFSSIDRVEIKTRKNAALTGLFVGALVDAAILLVVSINANKEKPRQRPKQTADESFSCPYFYSWDGQKFTLDSEPFGGALYRAAQRTDVDNLEHLREDGGLYRIRITNELPETQYIDRVALQVVDHPGGTRVVPDPDGEVYVVRHPLPPQKARTFGGEDIAQLVAEKDGRFWCDSPLSRDAAPDLPDRSGVVLEFPRPAHATRGILVLTLQNTLWASYLQGMILSLNGNELNDWYEFMNTTPEAREAFRRAFIREGMLNVQVFDGRRWRPAGYIWEVGPGLPKDQAFSLDLTGIPGNRLRVRLYATPGLWKIDAVGVSYVCERAAQVWEISPIRATGQDGRDLLSRLLHEDGEYYVMASNEDRAELIFQAPPLDGASERSVLLLATGYYHIHVQASGPANLELLGRLLVEPGAFSRYARRLFLREVMNVQEEMLAAVHDPGATP